MSHQVWNELVQLSECGELTRAEAMRLEEHLAECPACRSERASLRKLHGVMEESRPAPVPRELLLEARRELRSTLEARKTKQFRPGWLRGLFPSPAALRGDLAIGAVALFAAGVIAGISWPVGSPDAARVQAARQEGLVDGGEMQIANIRFISSDPSTGEIEFAFEAVKPVRMKGHVNDERIQRVLTRAILSEQNVGVRLASISAVSSAQAVPDRAIKTALIAALESDENAGVRAEALKALGAYPPDQEINDALLFVLTHDQNPALRITAINSLDSARSAGRRLDPNLLNVLRQTIESDNNNYIRFRARTVMEEHRQ